jgi:hypothetical protein
MAIRVKTLLLFNMLLAAGLLQAQQTLPATVDFDCTQCRPADALVQLSKQTGINIAFNDRLFERCLPISLHERGIGFTRLLEKIAACSKVSYQVADRQIVFYRKNNRFTLSGYLQDAETGERLIGASIRIFSEQEARVSSNEFGFFSIQLEEGTYSLAAIYIGYQIQTIKVDLEGNRLITINLQQDNRLPEVVVSGLPGATSREKLVGTPKDLPLESLRFLPMPGGEADVVRLAALQAGVQTGVDGLGGLHVRGGNADQNLFLLDDVPVYNPGHALGLFSIYNPLTVSSARLWKGDYPARFSGRVSSVLDVRTRDGNFKNYNVTVNAGLFATSMAVEGPIIRDRCSFLLAGRITYFDPWIRLFRNRASLITFSGNKIKYQFFDTNLKINYLLSEKDKVYFSYYQGRDQFRNSFGQDHNVGQDLVIDDYSLDSQWGNAIAALRWNHLLRNNLFTNTTIRYSRFFYQSQLGFNSNVYYATGKQSVLLDYAQLYETLIRDWSGKTDFTFYVRPQLVLRWGMSYTAHEFQPGALSFNFLQPGLSPTTIDSLSTALSRNQALEAGEAEVYFDSEYSFAKNWKLESGLNASVFQSKNTNYKALQPRVRLQRSGPNGWSQWGGIYHDVQHLHQIGTFNISLPFELWVPSTRNVKPEQVWQTSIGTGWQRNGWGIQMEFYYKQLDRVLAFVSNNDALYTGGPIDWNGWEDRVTSGKGKSRGLEFEFEKTKGNTTGSLAYTWSETNRQFDALNSGKEFPFRFDRRHDLKLTIRQRITSWMDCSGLWAFATGNPITLAAVKYSHESVEGQVKRSVYVYNEVNGFRLPDYHRFDFALNGHFTVGRSQHSVQLGVYNSYNRANLFFLYVDAGSNIKGQAIQYTLLPVLPSFRYQVKF